MKKETKSIPEQKIIEPAVAVVTLKGVSKMCDYDKTRLSNWLRQKADDVLEEGGNYSPTFRARLFASRYTGK